MAKLDFGITHQDNCYGVNERSDCTECGSKLPKGSHSPTCDSCRDFVAHGYTRDEFLTPKEE